MAVSIKISDVVDIVVNRISEEDGTVDLCIESDDEESCQLVLTADELQDLHGYLESVLEQISERLEDDDEEEEEEEDRPDWPWPMTRPYDCGPQATDQFGELVPHSPLALMGYHVKKGRKERTSEERKLFLSSFFLHELPEWLDEHYEEEDYIVEEYGEPSSSDRLKRMANLLASNCRRSSARADAANYESAISRWRDDLTHLKTTYYDQWNMRVNFSWPPDVG